jgi:hypothetical protein
MIMTLNERNGLYEQPAIHDSESGKAGTGLHQSSGKQNKAWGMHIGIPMAHGLRITTFALALSELHWL